MNEEYAKIIEKINLNIQKLISAYLFEKNKNNKLLKEIEQTNNELNIYITKYQELEQKYNNLKLAKIMSGNEENEKEAKIRLSKIIREIDNCIALLNK